MDKKHVQMHCDRCSGQPVRLNLFPESAASTRDCRELVVLMFILEYVVFVMMS